MEEAYKDDLAFIHQTGFNAVAIAAAGEIIAALKKAGREGGLIVDLGCGSGDLLSEVTRAGFKGHGVDRSPAFIKLAKKTAPRAKFRLASIWKAGIPTCEAVTAIGEVLNYLPGGVKKGPALRPLFRRVAKALRPGGIFLFDVILPDGKPSLTARGWRGGEDWAVLTDAQEDRKARLVTRHITTFRETKKGWRRSEERHVQYLYPRDEIVAALEEAGFAVRVLRRYETRDMLPRRLAFRATKRS